jgi:hypothetical protein
VSPSADDIAYEGWDLFISHASEDKKPFVAPLAKALADFGLRVWYDEFALRVGDSLSRSIDKGLSGSSFGIVVLSPAFFEKNWPEYELRGLVAKEMAGKKVILPIWHGVKYEDVLRYSPPLADKLSIRSDSESIERIAIQIIEVVRPDLFEKVIRRAIHLDALTSGKRRNVSREKIKMSPLRHPTLPDDLIGRVRLMRAALFDVLPHSMEYWLGGFQRDSHPTKEVKFWEHVATAYLECLHMDWASPALRQQIFDVIMSVAIGGIRAISPKKVPDLSAEQLREILMRLYSDKPIDDFEEAFPGPQLSELSEEELARFAQVDRETFPDVPDHLVRAAFPAKNKKTGSPRRTDKAKK